MDDWNDAVIECSSLAAKWEELSLYLGLSTAYIDTIKHKYSKDYSGCLREAMDLWIKQSYNTKRFRLPSRRTLTAAVAQFNKQLALEHQGNWCFEDV